MLEYPGPAVAKQWLDFGLTSRVVIDFVTSCHGLMGF